MSLLTLYFFFTSVLPTFDIVKNLKIEILAEIFKTYFSAKNIELGTWIL